MRASAFSPSHISGFFQVVGHSDELKAGSRGGGVVIDKGTRTDISVEDSSEDEINVLLNGVSCDCPVTRMVVDEFLELVDGFFRVEVSQSAEVPIRYGFGASGSGALSTALALNEALGLDLSDARVGQIAHLCEIRNMTGLGDVMAEFNGGLVVREKEGAPGIGGLLEIPCDLSVVAFIVGGELETKAVLKDEKRGGIINRIGGACLDVLLRDPTPYNFIRLSRRFSLGTGLLNPEVRDAMDVLEKRGVMSSMIMLGNSLFTLSDDPEGVCEMLDYKYVVGDIDNVGGRLL